MAEWSIASDLKSDELKKKFREFESHSLLPDKINVLLTQKRKKVLT